jgi:unsaturated rhamnogalacturonyl hydrolase
MFCYALAKSVRLGYISNSYIPTIKKAYNSIVHEFVKDNGNNTISITRGCAVAGLGGKPYRSGSFEYYIGEPIRDNDPKAVGPFIMACLEMQTLLTAK